MLHNWKLVEIVPNPDEAPRARGRRVWWRAVCTCGWTGEPFGDSVQAEWDGHWHEHAQKPEVRAQLAAEEAARAAEGGA